MHRHKKPKPVETDGSSACHLLNLLFAFLLQYYIANNVLYCCLCLQKRVMPLELHSSPP
jgi:hypothetical protein